MRVGGWEVKHKFIKGEGGDKDLSTSSFAMGGISKI